MHAIIPFLSVLGVGFGCCLTLCAAVPRFRPRAISRDPVTVLVALSLVSISLGLAGLGVARSYTKPLALVSFGAGCIASTFHHETRALWKDFLKTGKGKLLLVPPVIIGAARAWFKR
jgi:hypothetical protein